MIDGEVVTQQDGNRFRGKYRQQPGEHSLKVSHVGPPKVLFTAMHYCNLCDVVILIAMPP
jgi:hypothetical protein